MRTGMPVVLLVKAVEEADATHALLPLADREHATRETLRALGILDRGSEPHRETAIWL